MAIGVLFDKGAIFIDLRIILRGIKVEIYFFLRLASALDAEVSFWECLVKLIGLLDDSSEVIPDDNSIGTAFVKIIMSNVRRYVVELHAILVDFQGDDGIEFLIKGHVHTERSVIRIALEGYFRFFADDVDLEGIGVSESIVDLNLVFASFRQGRNIIAFLVVGFLSLMADSNHGIGIVVDDFFDREGFVVIGRNVICILFPDGLALFTILSEDFGFNLDIRRGEIQECLINGLVSSGIRFPDFVYAGLRELLFERHPFLDIVPFFIAFQPRFDPRGILFTESKAIQ